jgi:hypothetical protein
MAFHPPEVFQECLVQRRAEKGNIPQACKDAIERCGIDIRSKEKKVLEDLALWVEQEGKHQAQTTGEHPYHDRQHISETLTALSFFLEFDQDLAPEDKTLCLIAMLLHDFGHDGAGANKLSSSPETQEQRTVEKIKHPALDSLSSSQLKVIRDWILGTQFSSVQDLHQKYLINPSDRLMRMQTYINEADISASLTQALGYPLTRLFLLERDGFEPSLLDIQTTLQKFHQECFISTPVAKHYLNRGD